MPHTHGTPDRVVHADDGTLLTPDRVVHLDGGTGGAGTVNIEDEGVLEGAADTIDFTGAGVSVTFAGGTATVIIPGGGSGGSAGFLAIEKWSIV